MKGKLTSLKKEHIQVGKIYQYWIKSLSTLKNN